MCAGAIINARIPRVVFGAKDQKAGSCGSVVNLFALPYNHAPGVTGGVLEDCLLYTSGTLGWKEPEWDANSNLP